MNADKAYLPLLTRRIVVRRDDSAEPKFL